MLGIQFDQKVYEVREYGKFPEKRYFADKLIRSFSSQEESLLESIYLNKKHPERRFYAIDNPHEEIELNKRERAELNEKYGLL